MQAIILAAGRGRRLKELTSHTPKCLLPLENKRIIEHQIELLRKNKIKQIVVVAGYNFQKVQSALKNYKDIKFAFNPFYEQTNVLVSLWFGKQFLKGGYIFLHGDTIFEEGVLKALLKGKGDIVLATDFKECKKEQMKVKIKEGRIIKISKDMPLSEADGEFIGLARINRTVIDDLHSVIDHFVADKQFSCFFEAAIQEIIDDYRDRYTIGFIDTNGLFWEEIDFYKDYLRAENYYKKTRNR